MQKRSRKLWYGEHGQSLVEFALVTLFVILPVTFGIIDGGILFYKWVVVNNAAREGARAGAIYHYVGSVPGVGDLGDLALVDAAREAAIRSAVDDTVGPLVSIQWDQLADWDIGYEPSDSCVPPDDKPPCDLYDVFRTGASVAVRLTHKHRPFVGLVIGIDEIGLTATATMRLEPGGAAPTPTP